MAGTKTTALGSLILPAANDLFPVVDVSDTTMAASGTTKGIAQDKMTAFGIVNVKGYNASGSATTTTGSINASSATLTLAAAIDFVNGQGILVAGAGAAGADLVTTISSGAGTTTLTLATTAGTTVSNVLVQHDDTVAIQAAISAINTTAVGGGTVCFPDGVYRVNGPINSGQGNSILHILDAGSGGAVNGSIIKLCGIRSHFVGAFTSGTTSGAVILADRRAGSGATPSIIFGGSQTTVYVEHLTIRTPDNPTLDGLNLFDAFNASIKYVTVDTGTGSDVVTEPTNSTAGIRMPKTMNFGMTYLENVLIMGHDIGVAFSENTVFNNVIIYSCKLGLSALPGVVTSSGHLLIYRCAQLIKATTDVAYLDLTISVQNIAAAGNWFSRGGAAGTLKDIDDASNRLRGTIRYTYPGANINRNGATGLSGIFNVDSNTFELQPVTAHSLIAYANVDGQSTFRINNTSGTALFQAGSGVSESTRGAVYLGPITPGANNYTLKADGSTEVAINAPTGAKLSLRVNHGFTSEVNWNGTHFGIGVAYDATLTAQLHTSGSVRFANFSTGTATFDASGNLSSASDERLKIILGSFTPGLTAIQGLEPILYKWNEQSGMETENTYAGLSAQNVRDFIPEAVGENAEGILSISDRSLIAVLVNAVKELQAEVAALKAK